MTVTPPPTTSSTLHQHSPKHSSPLSKMHISSSDTVPVSVSALPSLPASPSTASTTSSQHHSPITPASSSPRSSASVSIILSSHNSAVASPVAESAPVYTSLSSRAADNHDNSGNTNAPSPFSLSSTSALSPTAPLFHSRLLDAPIDIHKLSVDQQPASANLSTIGQSTPVAAPLTQSHPRDVYGHASQSPPSTFPGSTVTQIDSNSVSLSNASRVSAPLSIRPPSIPTVDSKGSEADISTPNVYINGLPPNFPEEELFKMTREFGTVISVRTFTRHVCDKPSGYGFVLFETVDAAEKCIEALRKYRNLHPSFSKQIHKIPGTVYASAAFAPRMSLPADSFKARMEQLKDTASTNLYMEGLPLDIDELTLTALVKPYKIMSSRFFQTRLSNPPRMIAFVRLETRAAAEEIVERLHGRVVRGWQDDGCRISVRFADTNEQRELRRVERIGREGDQSPARITMAQAALLNLKGTQLQPATRSTSLNSPTLSLVQSSIGTPYLSSGLAHTQNMGLSPFSRGGALPLQQQQYMSQELDEYSYDDFSTNAAALSSLSLRAQQHALPEELLALQEANNQLQLEREMGIGISSTVCAENGYTPMERLVLQRHAQRQQAQRLLEAQRQREQLCSQPIGQSRVLQAQAASGMRQSLGVATNRGSGRRLLDVLPPMSEDDFHAGAAVGRLQQQQQMLSSASLAYDSAAAPVGQLHQRNQTHGTMARAPESQAQPLHARSTTLPSEYFGNRRGSQPFLDGIVQQTSSTNNSLLHNNISNHNRSMTATTSLSNANFRTMVNGSSSNELDNASTPIALSNTTNGHNSLRMTLNKAGNANLTREINIGHSLAASSNLTDTTIFHNSSKHTNSKSTQTTQITTVINPISKPPVRRTSLDEEDASPVVSPALTYSARTPVTLSPATPFSGFFHADETFEGPGMPRAEGQGVGIEIKDKQLMRADAP